MEIVAHHHGQVKQPSMPEDWEQDPTPRSIARAKAAREAELAKARREGYVFRDQRALTTHPIHIAVMANLGLPLDARVSCAEDVASVVKRHGLANALRALIGVAAADGVHLRVIEEDEAGQ